MVLSYFAIFLLFLCCLAAGVVAGVVHTWALRARTYSLETRLAEVEGILQREVKVRAGQERWRKPKIEEELLAAAVAGKAANAPAARFNWWENPALKKGAHVP